MKGLQASHLTDVRRYHLHDAEYAQAVAKMLERVTGDICAVQWEGPSDYSVLRQEPAGKLGQG
jgi:hypothetical protein